MSLKVAKTFIYILYISLIRLILYFSRLLNLFTTSHDVAFINIKGDVLGDEGKKQLYYINYKTQRVDNLNLKSCMIYDSFDVHTDHIELRK